MQFEQRIGQHLMLAFVGKEHPSEEIIHALAEYRASGVTLFRSLNIDSPAQVRQLTGQLQALARELHLPRLLIGTDQEGGQLMAVGGATQLPGNMALGAAGSTDLAHRAGEVLGIELAAMGINVNYAPDVDVNLNPYNPVVGIRSFGEDPSAVARLGAAMITGIQSQHVAATAKHFPGHGDASGDSHYGLPSVPHALERLQRVEFPPFESSIQAGVKMIMSAHLALPALDGPNAPPATLSANIMNNVLRRQLGFEGVIISDAMDMHAIRQGELLGADAVRGIQAGLDLLLLTSNPEDQAQVYRALVQALDEHAFDTNAQAASARRTAALKNWVVSETNMPDLSVVNCAEHQQVADAIAEASITLVRDQCNLLPLRLTPEQRVAVIVPRPQDLTPADTSSYIIPALASSIRAYHPNVNEFVIPSAPDEADIAAVIQQITDCDLVLIGTLNAFDQPGQQAVVREVLKTGIPTVVVALRLPYDLMAFPEVPTYVCTYSILEPSMRALAKALFGLIPIQGHLPVAIPGLYPVGK